MGVSGKGGTRKVSLLHNIIKYARYLHISIDDIMKMDTKDFFQKLNILDGQLAEEKFILQRQLDNHVKYGNKATHDKFIDIYNEFINQMDVTGKKITKELTEEENQKEWLEEHRANMRNQGL